MLCRNAPPGLSCDATCGERRGLRCARPWVRDRAITVVGAEQAIKNAALAALNPAMAALTPEQQQAAWQQQQQQMIQDQQVFLTQQAVMEDPLTLWKRAADKLPEWFPRGFKRCALFVPVPHLINCARTAAEAHQDFEKETRGQPPDLTDVARTVYAGNVNSSITEDMLAGPHHLLPPTS